MVYRNSLCDLLVRNGHARHLYTAFLHIEDRLECTALYVACYRHYHFGYMILIDNIQQLYARAKNQISFEELIDFTSIVVYKTDQAEWTGAGFSINTSQCQTGFAST